MHACMDENYNLSYSIKAKVLNKKASFRSLTKVSKMSEEPKPAKQLRSKRLENSLRANVFDMVSVRPWPSLLWSCVIHYNRSWICISVNLSKQIKLRYAMMSTFLRAEQFGAKHQKTESVQKTKYAVKGSALTNCWRG